MPIIDRGTVKVDGKWRHLNMMFTKTKGFYCDFDILDVMGVPSRGYETLRSLQLAIQETLQKYHDARKEMRKVIACRLHLSTEISMNRVDGHSFRGYKPWVPKNYVEGRGGFSTPPGVGFSIEWESLWEMKENGLKYKPVAEDGGVGVGERCVDGWVILDWTPDREKSLKAIDEALEGLAEKVSGIFYEPETLTKLLDSGRKLIGEK